MSSLATNNAPSEQRVYEAAGIVYKKASLSDDATLKSILRETAMDAWVTLSQEHEPSYFNSSYLFGHTETILAVRQYAECPVVGMCSSTAMPVHINGKPVTAGYLGELRVMPAYRNKPGVIRHGFKSVQLLNHACHELPYWFTSIAMQNSPARRLLEANLNGMPLYKPQGEMITYALSSKLGKHNLTLHAATPEDISGLVKFYNKTANLYQYSPVLSADWLEKLDGENGLKLDDFFLLKEQGQIRACFALWDQRAIKQTVVRGYRFPLGLLRKPYNLYAKLTRRVALPQINKQIDYIFIAFLAVEKKSADLFNDIIQTALYLIGKRKSQIGMLGLSADNPYSAILQTYPKQTYHTCIESVTWPKQAQPKWNNLPVQPEIAIL